MSNSNTPSELNPSGLTQAERNELVALWNKAGSLTKTEIKREQELKAKAR